MDPWLISKLANLEYDLPPNVNDESETDVKAILKLPINISEMRLNEIVYCLLDSDNQQVRSTRTNIAVPMNASQYTLHFENTIVRGARLTQTSNCIANLEALLSKGWIVKQLDKVIFDASDVSHLVVETCFNEPLLGIVTICVNDLITRNCNWRLGRQSGTGITTYIAAEDVVVGKGDELFEENTVVSSEEYVAGHVTRCLEQHLDKVFEFISSDRDAFYNATNVGGEIIVSKYADARAIIWSINEKRKAWATSDIDNDDERVPSEKERRHHF